LSGWVAVDLLRANAVPIDPSIMQKAFPPPEINKRKSGTALTAEHIKPVQPRAMEQVTLLAVLRDLFTETKRTKSLNKLGEIGAKLLHLPKGQLWQATLVVNSVRPNLTYTCMIPERLGLPRDSKNKMVFAQLQGRVVGVHAIWLVTDIRLL
jgi:hypothetical protein